MYDHKKILNEVLDIDLNYCSSTPINDIFECFFCGKWIRTVRQELIYFKPSVHPTLTPSEIQSALQLGENIGDLWQRIYVQILPKENYDVFTLPRVINSLKPHLANNLSFSQLLHYVSAKNTKNLWKESYQRFEDHAVIKQWKEGQKFSIDSYKNVLRSALLRLYKCPIINLARATEFELKTQNSTCHSIHLNIHPAVFIIESFDNFFVFLEPTSFSVFDCVNYSPAKLKENECGALFILYQLLEGMQIIQDCGLYLGNISLHHLRLGPDFHLTIIPQITDSLFKAEQEVASVREDSPDLEGFVKKKKSDDLHFKSNVRGFRDFLSCTDAINTIEQFGKEKSKSLIEDLHSSLLKLTQKWVVHEISNFDYLLCLSYFAGHSFESPAYYPILPWVTDFTSSNGGWRDLTKTKYRLNKGDQQLDHTYELAENDPNFDQIAHHIPEFFSEVTYYVYKARVTPKQILKKHVRQQFVASHYPSSIARMYSLTPEECIPEFFCDPSIFKSMHEDLPDLEVPSWCDGVEDFLHVHRAALESNYVSRRLHHWIDLYYGYKLTGGASVKAKNVCLPLVDDHSSLTKGGIVQLFNIPHPPKLTPSPFLSKSPPLPYSSEMRDSPLLKSNKKASECVDEFETPLREDAESSKDHSKYSKSSSVEERDTNKIELPINYNPLTSLNQVEMLYNFFLKTSGKLPDALNKDDSVYSFKEASQLRTVRDTQVVGCLIIQMFSHSRCRVINSTGNLEETYRFALKILQEPNDIPKCLYNALGLIFQHDINEERSKFDVNILPSKFSAVTDYGLPPPNCHQMLQPLVNIISFPNFFPRVSLFVKTMKRYSKIRQEFFYVYDEKKEELFKSLTEKHIQRTAMDLKDLLPYFTADGVNLILPYVIDLYNNPLSSISAAWHFSDIISQALGPTEANRFILPLLIKLFEADSVSKSHLKLFHQNFLLQLMVRLRLKTFLKYFITPIIEGAGGYKAPMEGYREISGSESLKQSNILRDSSGGFEMEDQKHQYSDETLTSKGGTDSGGGKKDFKRRNSSIRSPSGAENDITDAENDTDIFVFEGGGGEDDDTLNDFGATSTMEMNDSLKSPVSDTVSLDEDSLQEGGGSIPSLCPSPHSPTLSGDENEDNNAGIEVPLTNPGAKQMESPLSIPIPHSKILELHNNARGYSSSLPEKPLDPRKFEVGKDSNADTKSVDFRTYLKDDTFRNATELDPDISLAELCCQNILWLSHRLGPVLTARHLTRNLLRMLSLCYLPESGALSPLPINQAKKFSVTMKEVVGDENSARILQCLSEISDLYGEQVILLQYLSHITELVSWCGNKLNTSQEAGLIGAMTLLQHFLHKLSDVTFMDYLQETLIRNAVYPVIRLLSSLKVYFPNGVSVRTILAWRVIDSLCIMVQRVGRDMSKEKLIPTITRFLTAFSKAHSSKLQLQDESRNHEDMEEEKYSDAKSTGLESLQKRREKTIEELKNVFTPELAYLSYVPLCKLLGTKCMEDSLPNHDLLRSLCIQYDENKQADYAAVLSMDGQSSLEIFSCIDEADSSITPDVAVTGNRIDIKDSSESLFRSTFEGSSLFNFNIWKHSETKSENNSRHLRGNWLAYWEHEIGRSEQDGGFNFKQIKLQSFVGHSNSVKSVYVLDNENSFISCSKDKTVKLWSLRSQGDGNADCGPQWTYSNHKKSVFDVAFSESLRLAASCDSTVHIWDPFTGTCLKQLDSLRHSPVTVLTAMSSPSTQLITATTDSTLKFIDLRTCNYTHELKITTSSVGLVRCLATSENSHLVAVAHSSGVISTLDLRTGQLLSTWKPHEGEVLTLNWYQKGTFISSALDQTICVWSVYDNKLKFILKGPSEPVHLLKTFEDEILTGTTANRIGLHTSVSPNASFACTKLRADTFKGVLTAMATLPLNRQLLLGADNGTIKLLC